MNVCTRFHGNPLIVIHTVMLVAWKKSLSESLPKCLLFALNPLLRCRLLLPTPLSFSLSSFRSISMRVCRDCGAPAERWSRSIHQRHGGLSPWGGHWIQCHLLSPASVHCSEGLDHPPTTTRSPPLSLSHSVHPQQDCKGFIWLYFQILEVSLISLA